MSPSRVGVEERASVFFGSFALIERAYRGRTASWWRAAPAAPGGFSWDEILLACLRGGPASFRIEPAWISCGPVAQDDCPDVGDVDGTPYVAFPWEPGVCLARLLDEESFAPSWEIPTALAIFIVEQLARGLLGSEVRSQEALRGFEWIWITGGGQAQLAVLGTDAIDTSLPRSRLERLAFGIEAITGPVGPERGLVLRLALILLALHLGRAPSPEDVSSAAQPRAVNGELERLLIEILSPSMSGALDLASFERRLLAIRCRAPRSPNEFSLACFVDGILRTQPRSRQGLDAIRSARRVAG